MFTTHFHFPLSPRKKYSHFGIYQKDLNDRGVIWSAKHLQKPPYPTDAPINVKPPGGGVGCLQETDSLGGIFGIWFREFDMAKTCVGQKQ